MPKNEQAVDNIPMKVAQFGMHSAMINGEIVHNIPSYVVYVANQSELSSWTNEVPVGTFAVTYGGANAWQLKPDGTWVEA